MIEIERKFLVTSTDFKAEADSETRIVQGYLNSEPERTVRIRIKGDKGFITVKGKSDEEGTTRFEWEREISIMEAEALMDLCEDGVIEKVRYEIMLGKHTYEVDEFFGNNHGLVVAEIELSAATEHFKKPKWLGKEVTGDSKYYNSQLSNHPFVDWSKL